MIFSLFMCSILLGDTTKYYQVKSTLKTVTLDSGEFQFNVVKKVARNKSTFFVMDYKDLKIWSYDIEKDTFFNFGEMGSGPGQIREKVTSFYLSDDKLNVINANGSRLDVFGLDGELIDSKALGSPSPLYIKGSLTLIQKDHQIILQDGGVSSAKSEGFSPTVFGRSLHTAKIDDFFIVATETSNNNSIKWAIFNLSSKKVIAEEVCTKICKTLFETLPSEAKKELSEIDMNYFFFNNFQTILTDEAHGFLFLEYYMSTEQPRLNVLHAIEPATGKRSLKILRNGAKYTFLLPQEKYWLAYNSELTRFEFLKVVEVQN